MATAVTGIEVQLGAYTAAYQQQLERQQEDAEISQVIGQDVVGSGAPFPVDTSKAPGLFVVFA